MRITALNKALSEKLITLLVIALLAWISFFPQPVTDKYWLATRLLPWAILLFLIFSKKYKKGLLQLSDWPLWLALICLLSGVVTASVKIVAWKTYFYLVSNLFTLFYIGKALFNFQEDKRLISSVLSLCGMVVVLIGLSQFFLPERIFCKFFMLMAHCRNPLRLASTQYNPIVLGSYLLPFLPFILYYFFANKTSYWRILGLLCFSICVIVILNTLSRGALMGLVVMSSFWLWLKNRKKTLIILFTVLFLLITFYSLQSHLDFERVGTHRLLSIRKTDSARLERMVMSLRILRDHPFFGIGLNHFRIRFNEYYNGARKWGYDFRIPDNMYFCLLSETGVFGFSGFFIFIFVLYMRGLKRLRCLKGGDAEAALLVSLSALSGLLANAAVYELFYWNSPYMLFCLICGFIQGAAEEAGAHP